MSSKRWRFVNILHFNENKFSKLIFKRTFYSASYFTVNVDEFLQEAETLSVQDMPRSASSLSVRTDASGAAVIIEMQILQFSISNISYLNNNVQ